MNTGQEETIINISGRGTKMYPSYSQSNASKLHNLKSLLTKRFSLKKIKFAKSLQMESAFFLNMLSVFVNGYK